MAISAFNALTLTPALSALLLGKVEKPKGIFFRVVNRAIDGGTSAMVAMLRGLIRVRALVALVFLALLGATYWVYTRVPTGFVPDADQGYVMIIVQAPPGASLDYTMDTIKQTEQILQKTPESHRMFAAGGFGFAGSAPNQGILFVQLKDFKERTGAAQSAQALVGQLFGGFSQITGAMVIPFLPPTIQGLSVFGGFTYELLDQSGGPIENLEAVAQQVVAKGNQTPGLTSLFTQFTANDPQLVVDIDREQAKSLGMSLGDINNTMQILLGSSYVNDFDFNNRSYRVYVQADQRFRSNPGDIERYSVRTAGGRMMPLSNVVSVREATAPKIINHFNLFRSAEINGAAAPAQAKRWRGWRLSDETLPQGFSYAWSGIARRDQSGQPVGGDLRSLLLVYLTLAAQ
jgi:HAE1 family hydrophobic/amphiphilic exporter-1